jgi:hypothetical protein
VQHLDSACQALRLALRLSIGKTRVRPPATAKGAAEEPLWHQHRGDLWLWCIPLEARASGGCEMNRNDVHGSCQPSKHLNETQNPVVIGTSISPRDNEGRTRESETSHRRELRSGLEEEKTAEASDKTLRL